MEIPKIAKMKNAEKKKKKAGILTRAISTIVFTDRVFFFFFFKFCSFAENTIKIGVSTQKKKGKTPQKNKKPSVKNWSKLAVKNWSKYVAQQNWTSS